MATSAPPFELLHLAGFLTGAVLYGMLLALVTRGSGRVDGLGLTTAVLGLAWNVGRLAVDGLPGLGWDGAVPWVDAASFTALGLLGAVVVHAAARAVRVPALARALSVLVYGSALVAAGLHAWAAVQGQPLPSAAGLTWMTVGLVVTVPLILLSIRGQLYSPRTLWFTALAVFAVSALHLGRFHGPQQSWPVELVGHHASILLAFAWLYHDYRFAFADIFLKQALTLLALVGLVGAAYLAVSPLLMPVAGAVPVGSVVVLLLVWTGTALAFPALRRVVTAFVDRVVLGRESYDQLVAELSESIQRIETCEGVLQQTCAVLTRALTASEVTWAVSPSEPSATGRDLRIVTAEPPHYVVTIGPLRGGRRLLSDDVSMLERVAFVVARRLDAVRITTERYERMLQEREMRSLAAEAELRALRSQINPHFLFNALTTIGYLIQHGPGRAQRALLRLTTLLRSVLRSEGEFTTLGRDRELVDCYLQIERERFEERLEYLIDIPEDLADASIPAFLIQPLVENAIKHGVAGAVDGGLVAVSARRTDHLEVVVRNTGLPLGQSFASGTGVGLRNVERRLHHYFGPAASVTLASAGDGATVATLRMPSRVSVAVVEQAVSGRRP